MNHPTWSLDHLAGASVGILKVLGHEASLPGAWGDVFKSGGIPSADTSVYPSKEGLLATYEALHAQVAAAVAAANAATLAQAHPNEGTRQYFPTVG